MYWFSWNVKNFDSGGAAGPPDVASQHAQIAAQKENENQDQKGYKGLIANIPGIGKLDTAADALKLLNESIAPKIDSIANLGKDGGGIQTGSIASSFNPGGLAGSLKIFGEMKALQTEGYDASILEGRAPSLNNSEGASADQSNFDGGASSGDHESVGGSSSSDSGDFSHGANQDYSLPDLSGIGSGGGSSGFSDEGGLTSKFSQGQSSFASKFSSSAGGGDEGHGRD